MKKRLLIVISIVLVTLAITALCVATDIYLYVRTPASISDDTLVIFWVKPGETFGQIVRNLERKGLIKHPFKFELASRYLEKDNNLIAGEYILKKSMTPAELLETISSGRVKLHRLTIPEGLNMHEVAQRVADSGLSSKEAFLASAIDPDVIAALKLPGPTCEGYLFPDTYFFSIDLSPEQIISTLVARFHEVFSDPLMDATRKMGFTVHQIVTLASIIEKETAVDSERPIISSVFHNRLKKKMRLESDPTVIYGMKNYNGNITKKDLLEPTPYNTYRISGLPPSPIANPGFDSLKAALHPAQTDYLYFVAKPGGTHHFSKTLKEHSRAVRKYQLRPIRK